VFIKVGAQMEKEAVLFTSPCLDKKGFKLLCKLKINFQKLIGNSH
jgi:hypothetical protein